MHLLFIYTGLVAPQKIYTRKHFYGIISLINF